MGGEGVTTAVASVAQARETLRVALVGLQEAALGNDNASVTARLLHAAELVAEATSLLFELELTPEDAPNRGGEVARAREILHDALVVLQAPDVFAAISAHHVESVANALAVIYVVSRAEQRRAEQRAKGQAVAEREAVPLRSKRRGLVLVPEADSIPPQGTAREDEAARAGGSTQAAAARIKDGRRATRAVLEVDVGYVSESNFYAGLSMDISAGGLFVATYRLAPVGTAVTMTFMLPGGHTITTPGEVRWVREASHEGVVPGMGVAFLSLSPRDLRLIEEFARERTPMYHDSGDS